MNKYFIVTMYRWGCRENHSYVLGLFNEYFVAVEKTTEEEMSRGGKYQGEIIEVELNEPLREIGYHKVVHGQTELNCEVCDNKKCFTKTIWKKAQKKKSIIWRVFPVIFSVVIVMIGTNILAYASGLYVPLLIEIGIGISSLLIFSAIEKWTS